MPSKPENTQKGHEGMADAQREARKHHFVPRSLLRYFRPPAEEGEYLFVYNKQSGRTFQTSLMNAGSENGFNSYQEGEEIINFERDFDGVDGLLATRLREIHAAKNSSALTKEHCRDWANLVAVQLLRTPIVRSTMIAFFEELNAQVEDLFGSKLDMPTPTEDDAPPVSE